MENKQTLGSLLKDRRKKLKLTTEELAKKAAIDRTYITKIERHNKLPSPVVMEKICKALSSYDLFSCYIKIKYPDVYLRAVIEKASMEVELDEIRKKLDKKNISLEEAKKLGNRIAHVESAIQELKVKVVKLIKRWDKIKHPEKYKGRTEPFKELLPIKDILS